MNDSLQTAVRGVRWIAASRIVIQVSTWLLTILSIRFLQPSDYGLVAIAGLFTVLTTLTLEGGLTAALVHEKPSNPGVYASVSTLLFLAGSAVTLVLCVIAPFAAELFDQPALTNVLRFAALQFPLAALTVVPNALLLGDMRFRALAMTQAIVGVSQGLATVLLAWWGFGYWALIWATIAAALAKLLLMTALTRPPLRFALDRDALRPYLAVARNIVPQRMTWFAVQELDTFLIGRALGAARLGAYSTAKTLSHTLLDRIGEIVNQVSQPMFAAKKHDPQAWASGFAKVQSFYSSVTFPICWGLAAVAPLLLPLLLGAQWQAAIVPFVLFCMVMPFRVGYALNDAILNASGHSALSFGNVLVWAVVLVPLLFGAILLDDVRYMAGALAVGFPFVFLRCAYRTARTLGIEPRVMLAPVVSPLLLCVAMWAIIQGIAWLLGARMPATFVVAIEIGVGAAFYVLGLRLLARARFDELWDLTRRFAGR